MIKRGVKSSQTHEVVEAMVKGVATFLHDCPALITTMDALSNAHPAIQGI